MRLLSLALALALAAPAAEAASCRDDQLGSVLCRDLVRPEPRPLTRPAPPEAEAGPSAGPLIPGWRENAFGRIVPERERSDTRRFRGPLAVGNDRLLCFRNALGHVRCR